MAKIDFKQAAINHVEKAIFGIVIVVVLLGIVGANWSPYDGTPKEITDAVRSGKANLTNHSWPEEERELYPVVKTDKQVDRALYAAIDPRPIENSVDPVFDPYGGAEPVREPVLLAPEDLVAKGGRVFIHEDGPVEDEESEDETELADATTEIEEDDNIADELRTRKTSATGLSGEMGLGGGEYGGGSGYEDLVDMAMLNGTYGEEGGGYSGGEYGGGYPGLGEGEFGEMGMGAARPKLKGLGYHFVSVRAVFNLREQISKFADATNTSYQQAAAKFEIIDFELERQSKQPGANPWPEGDEFWEPVDLNVAFDVLDSAAGFEPDVVNGVVTNSVITMPLPTRISGEWFNLATHDRIKNFELTDKQVEIEREMNRAMLDEMVKSKKQIRQSAVKRKGFNEFQFDNRELGSAMFGFENPYSGGGYGSESDYGMDSAMSSGMGMRGGRGNAGRGRNPTPNNSFDALIKRLAKDTDDPQAQEEKEKAIREWIKERVSVSGELLLFRYFDFGVEPGKTYRYRVRFVLQNPNFGKRIADAGGLQHVVEGETRTTDWSNVTQPTTVLDDTQFFVTRVNDLRSPSGSSGKFFPSAFMDVYQWDTSFGTMVNKSFEVLMGQTVGDEVKAEVIDAGAQTKEEQDYVFASNTFVVDTIEDIQIDQKFHSNDRMDPSERLELLRGHRNNFRTQGKVLVRNEDGDLVEHGESENSKPHKGMQKYMELQAKQYEHLEQSELAMEDFEGAYGEEGGMEAMMMGGMMMGGEGRGRSVMQKRRGSSSRSRSRGRGRGAMESSAY